MAATVGEIVAHLKIDASQWYGELERAEAKARELGTVDPTVKVKTDGTARATAELEAVRLAEDRANQSAGSASSGFQKQTNVMGGLVGALVAVSAAAPPVAAGALSIAGALGVAGGVGVLAILGISKAYHDNTAAGDEARATVGGFLNIVTELEQRAAPGVLTGLSSGLTTVRRDMPELNRDVGQFSDSLGRIISTGAPGMLSFLHQLMPLFGNAELYVERIVAGFGRFAGSNGFTQFVGYAIANLPNVEAFLGQVVNLAFRLLAAWAPLGAVALPILTELVHLIASIPLPILTAMITAVAAGAAAFSLYQAVPAKLLEVVAAEGIVGAASAGMAAAIDLATGPVGWIIGAITLLGAGFMAATQSERDLATATANYTQQLEAQNSVSSETLRAQVAQQAVQSGLIAQGQRFGISAATTVNAMLGQRDATRQVGQALQQYVAASGSSVAAQAQAHQSTVAYTNGVTGSNVATRQAVAAAKQYAAAMGASAPPVRAAAAAAKTLAGDVDLATTAEYRLASTSDNAVIAIGGMKSTLEAAAKAAKDHKASLDGDTVAGAQNREAVLSAMSAISKHAQEMRTDGHSAAEAKAYTDKMTASLIDNAVKAGANRDAVAGLIAKILGIPKSAAVKITAETAAAEARLLSIREHMNNLQGMTADIYVNAVASGVSTGRAAQVARNAYGQAHGGTVGDALSAIPRSASGSTVQGPGTASSDSVLRWVANGEEIISNLNGQASTFRPILKGINSGALRSPADLAGALGGQQHVVVHVVGDDSAAASFVRVHVQQGLTAQQARDARTQRMGWQGKGLLAAPTGA